MLGVVLHTYTAVFQSSGNSYAFLILLFAWSCFPYLLCLVGTFLSQRVFAVFASVGCLAVDLATYHSVFISPTSSTAALGLLFAPAVNLVVVLPIAMVATWLLGRVFTSGVGS